MELKSKLWMTGSLEWFTYIDGKEVFLGRREVPAPLEEGDAWTNERGEMFRVVEGEIRLIGRSTPPRRYW